MHACRPRASSARIGLLLVAQYAATLYYYYYYYYQVRMCVVYVQLASGAEHDKIPDTFSSLTKRLESTRHVRQDEHDSSSTSPQLPLTYTVPFTLPPVSKRNKPSP